MYHCDNCNREATVYYRVSINGHTEEKHLCAECAAREEFSATPFSLSGVDEVFGLRPLFVSPKTTKETESTPKTATGTQTCEPLPQTSPPPSLATLKAQLKRAVRQEDYLKAARLRDQIRTLEGK